MVGSPKRNRIAERREATRREILTAAWASAHEHGLAGLTLRDVADRVGMQPPSLYGHFPSKNAIYDAMFAQGWEAWNQAQEALADQLPPGRRARLLAGGLAYFDFAVADPERHLLMNVRTVPGFTPSAEAYQPAVQSYEQMRQDLLDCTQDDLDVFTALLSGLISQQLANDPGGQRWRRLLPRVVSFFADDLGLPPDADLNGSPS